MLIHVTTTMSNHLVFITGTIVGASAAAALSYYWLRCRTSVNLTAADSTKRAVSIRNVLHDDILKEHFTRNIQFFGEEAQQRFADSLVVVVGLGGVGSHAAHMLLRAGVGRLRLVDFDQVSLSTLNRHAVATRADVGLPKATVLAHHFEAIVPEATVEPMVAMYTADTRDAILADNPTYVIDAIDNIDTKVDLLATCKQRGIPVIASAGAGAKVDPTRIRITETCKHMDDPLARSVRRRLAQQHNMRDCDITMVVSTERPRANLLPPDEFTADLPGQLHDYQVIPNFRIRTIPVLGTTPAMFGMAAAAHVICSIAQFTMFPEPVFGVREGVWTSQLAALCDRLEEAGEDLDTVLRTNEVEVAFLVRDVWRGVSTVTLFEHGDQAGRSGAARDLAGLVLTRWDPKQTAHLGNLVLLSQEQADAHDAHGCIAAVHDANPVYAAFVEQRLATAVSCFDAGRRILRVGHS